MSEVAGTIRLSLIGREPERILIERHVAEATAGAGGRVLALLGEPGIGKSRLLEELRARVNAAGGVVLGGRAESAEMIRPYGAFIDALRGLPRERLKHVPPALRWLIPELADVPRDSDADRTQLFDALVTFMRTLAGSAPAALVIDDVQWVDEASAALFHYAARELSGGRVVFAIGARPAELADNRAASRMLRALSRDGRLTELALGPLDALGVRALATAAGAADLEAVSSMSGGNPLFAIELSRSTTPNEVPRSLNAVLSERLERLDPRALSILPWAAALGGAFEASLLAQVTASAGLELVDALADLERQGVLREMPSGFDVVAYDFAHDLIRRAAYRTLSEPRRRVVHLTIARALSQAPDLGGALSVDIAHHAALGGDPELAARACVTAGERSLRLFAREEAEAFALRGLTLAERVSEPARLRLSIALLKLRVEARTASSRSSDIEAALTRAGSLATASGLETDAATAFYALTMHRHWCGDHAGAHRDSLIAAERAKGATPLARARVFANAGACLAELERESQRARTLLLEAQGLVDSEGGDDLADIWLGLALLLHMEGRIEEARPLAERALAIARTTEDEWRQFWALRRLAMMDIEALRFDSASRRTEAMAELATRTGDGSEKAIAEALEAVAKLGRDEPSAPEALVRSSAHLACVDAKAMLAYAQLFAAETHLAKGDHERAKLAAEVALGAAETLGQGNLVALAHAALGRAARARGDDRAEREHGGASLLAMGSGPEEPTARARAAVAALTVRPGAEREPLKVAGAPISTDTKTVASTQSVHLRKNPGGRHGSHRR